MKVWYTLLDTCGTWRTEVIKINVNRAGKTINNTFFTTTVLRQTKTNINKWKMRGFQRRL